MTLNPMKGGTSWIVKERVKLKGWRVRVRMEKGTGLMAGMRVENRW